MIVIVMMIYYGDGDCDEKDGKPSDQKVTTTSTKEDVIVNVSISPAWKPCIRVTPGNATVKHILRLGSHWI